jgi:hypothetical protein
LALVRISSRSEMTQGIGFVIPLFLDVLKNLLTSLVKSVHKGKGTLHFCVVPLFSEDLPITVRCEILMVETKGTR